MATKVTDHSVEFEQKITQKVNIFLRLFTEQTVETAFPKTPKRDNFLRKDVLKQVLGLNAKIIWDKAYAAVQERGSRKDGTHKIRNYTTPGTGPHFAENAIKDTLARTGEIARRAGLIT